MSRVSQARNLGKYFLLIDNMLVVLGFFVVFPLISIRFVDQMGWAAVMVGIALGLRQFIQQGLGIFGGAIADRFGAKPMIVTGMLMRAAGFATMGIAHEPWLLWFSCLLSGLGGTLFDPPRSALVVKLIRPQQRGRFFSLLMMQDSAGAVIGALLGGWLLQYDFRLVCATGAVLFVLCAAFNAWLLPAWKLSTVRTPVREGMTRVNVGYLRAGEGRNVIASTAEMQVEVRGETAKINTYMYEEAKARVQGAAAMYGVSVEEEVMGEAVDFVPDLPLRDAAAEVAKNAPYVDKVQTTMNFNGSDDATVLIKRVQEKGGQGAYLVVGSDLAAGHHQSAFDFEEKHLLTLFTIYRDLILRHLGGH